MIELQNVSFNINENGLKKDILKDVSLKFESGKITAITGQNGSGKSTLLKIMMGIIAPNSGKILLNGKDITNLAIQTRADLGITMAFQQPVRFKGLSVKDIIDTASRKNNNIKDACEYLSNVGLCAKDYLNRKLDDALSGGEIKRIEIALALAKGGDVFLFDEPEAGVDLWSFEELISAIKKLKNKTIIIVSHQKYILENSDNVLVLNSDTPPMLVSPKDISQVLQNGLCTKLGGVHE